LVGKRQRGGQHLALEFALSDEHGGFGLPTAGIGYVHGRSRAAGDRQRNAQPDTDDGLAITDVILGEKRADADAGVTLVAGEAHRETLLLQLHATHLVVEIILTRCGEQCGRVRHGVKRERGSGHAERCIDRHPTELVQFDEGTLKSEFGLGGATLEGKFAGLNHPRLQERGDARRIAGEEGFLESGEAVRHFTDRSSLGVCRIESETRGCGRG
jgi:hypothetical protein